jgi:hypothetical protein
MAPTSVCSPLWDSGWWPGELGAAAAGAGTCPEELGGELAPVLVAYMIAVLEPSVREVFEGVSHPVSVDDFLVDGGGLPAPMNEVASSDPAWRVPTGTSPLPAGAGADSPIDPEAEEPSSPAITVRSSELAVTTLGSATVLSAVPFGSAMY